ncbi:MAG: translocation/assembly module TamB domain-containing protein, partial [Gemmatimonadales bacterium]
GVHQLGIRFADFDLTSLHPALPATRLTGRLSGAGSAMASGRLWMVGEASLNASVIEGVGPVRADARVTMDENRIAIDSLHVLGYALEGSASGTLARNGASRDTLTFVAETDSVGMIEQVVARWLGPVDESEVASRPSGEARVSGRLVGSVGSYELLADFGLENVQRGDLHLSQAGGTATWVSATRTLRLDGTADSLRFGGLAVGGLQLQLHGRPDSLQWFGRSRYGFGAWRGRGEWHGGRGRVLAVDTLMLSLESGLWLADSRAAVAMDDSGLVFSRLNLRNVHGPGQVSIAGRWPFRGVGQLEGSIDGFTLSDALLLLLQDPDLGAGELSGTFHLRGSAGMPIIEANLSLQGGRYRRFRVPYTQGVVRYRARRLTGDVELWRFNEQILKVTAELPLDLALVEAERRRLPGPIRIRARADSADLALFEAITPTVRDLAGTLDADFGVEGTWENPELAGGITVQEGSATLPALGVRYRQLNGRLILNGDTISVDSLSLASGAGTARIRGYVRLEELTRPILSLDIRALNLDAIDIPGFLRLTATGDVALDGPIFEASLTGRGTATRGVLHFADLLAKDVINLEDSLFAQFVDTSLVRRQGLGAQVHSRFLDSLRIDSLRLQVGDEFWMRSRDANVQLGGAVVVNKIRGVYRLDGTLEARRGTYRLQLGLGNSREFTVTGGEIRYLGTPDLNADLDVDAVHQLRTTGGEDLRVFVNIGGSLYDPRLRLSSEIVTASGPSRGLPLSEPEIIGYLLFGAPTLAAGASQSGFQSRLVTQQVFGALSGPIEYSLITDMGVPLDYLQLRPTTRLGGLSGFEAAIGKQFQVLGTTAFLSASPHFCTREQFRPESIGAGLEFRLNRQWLVSASVDPIRSCELGTAWTAPNYQFGADLFWEKRF